LVAAGGELGNDGLPDSTRRRDVSAAERLLDLSGVSADGHERIRIMVSGAAEPHVSTEPDLCPVELCDSPRVEWLAIRPTEYKTPVEILDAPEELLDRLASALGLRGFDSRTVEVEMVCLPPPGGRRQKVR